MMDYGERVEKLLDRLSEDNLEIDALAADRLRAAADNICGAINALTTMELCDNIQFWQRLPPSTRQEILFAYTELGRQGRNFSDSRGVRVSYLGKGPRLPTDLDSLVNESGIAQYIAHLWLRIDETLDPKAIRLLVMAALQALLTMRALTDVVIERGRQEFFSGRIDSGLRIIEESLKASRSHHHITKTR